ncbi:MAG: hypothetical protein ABL931_17460 [Usitatibacteraceae bacterium]
MQTIDTRNLQDAAASTLSDGAQLPVFDFMADAQAKADSCWEEHGYRTLINHELKRQDRPISFLVIPLGRSRSYVSRVLSGQNKLTQELREKAFVALEIDPIRANISVAWLKDVGLYHAMDVRHISDYFREYLVEVISVRQGCIKLAVKPAILREAARRTVDTIMKHQERVFENETHLLE